ncbi:MAG: tetratricopeptide repeat protein [Gammaproteobacteria bacterium]|nr:tetratricopeptide repeat protein [Gammaproteobacteria bacterium]
MSLLLDALKKAEKEKQKAREAETATATENEEQQSESSGFDEELSIQQESEAHHEEELQAEGDADIELVLDEVPAEQEEVTQEDIAPEVAEPVRELEKSAATTSTVSDEALQLLVYKTNKKYRQKQKAIWGGLLSATIVILMSAGAYYYYGMLEEVDALEHKHKLAMRNVRAEPIKQQQTAEPVKAVIVEPMQSSEVISKTKRTATKKEASLVQVVAVKHDVSIKKTNTEDPVNVLLRNAWAAYNKEDYLAANRGYEKVLKREPKNRDGLLGVAAVAVKNANYKKARASYQLLLKLNPRDQVAMAAMTNINELSVNNQNESQLKFMLQQQPSATHLNFALGNSYARKSKWPEAQSEYFKAWQGDSKNADYAYNLAVSLDQLGKKKEALQFYKKSLLLASDRNISFSKSEVERRIQQILVK